MSSLHITLFYNYLKADQCFSIAFLELAMVNIY